MNTLALTIAGILALAVCPRAADFRVEIAPPEFSSSGAILAAEVPASFPESGTLSNGGEPVPFQKNGSSGIVFIAPLRKGEASTWSVKRGEPRVRVTAENADGKVAVKSGGRLLFVYQGEETELPRPGIKAEFKRGGYLHPIFSPTGRVVTDDYPPNHIHHHGVWFPWTKTKFEGRAPDFWNMGQGSGKVEFVRFGQRWSGPVHAGFEARHRFVDLTASEPKAALNETWSVAAYAVPDSVVFDLVSTQECATDAPLELPKYHYGGLGFRGNWAWNGRDKCRFLTSNGETNRIEGNETRGNWCYIGGEIDGKTSGIVIFSHPDNLRSPQPMRLHPSEPFFCYSPSQGGDWSIQPGKPYVSRYRFVTTDGAPDKARFDRLWLDYANPPRVSVEKF